MARRTGSPAAGRRAVTASAPPLSPPPAPRHLASRLPLVQLWETTWSKAWSYGGAAFFFLGIPFTLYLIKERRGLSWAGLLEHGARLPFSD